MAFELHDNRTRAVGVVATLCANGLLLLLLLTLARGLAPPTPRQPGLATFEIAPPPPHLPPPPARPQGAAAPSSRGIVKAPSPAMPARPLPHPVPTPPALDAGSQAASGAGSTAGSGAGQGGQGSGSGSGGAGSGSGAATGPVHVAGALTDADYSRAGLPKGARGTVVISFRVRKDGGVDSCVVVRSSGYAAIDRDTCNLVEQRFRFRPARDSAGQPIDFTLRTDFTWQPR